MASYTTPTATQFYRNSWSMDMAKEYLYDTQDDYCFFQIQHGAGVPDVYVLVTGNYVDTLNNQYIFEDATYYTFQNNMNLGTDVTINIYDELYVPISGDGKLFTSMYDDFHPSLINRQEVNSNEIIAAGIAVFFAFICIERLLSFARVR